MKYIHPTTYVGLVLAILLLASTAISLHGYTTTHKSNKVVFSLYKLRSDITAANIALRNAGMAQSAAVREIELAKMLVTRSSANEIYDYISGANLAHGDAIILQEMKKERVEYREAQLKVINLIREGKDQEAWNAMMYYQTLMDRYLNRVDKLIVNTSKCSEDKYVTARANMLAALIASLALGACTMRRLYWGPR